MQQIARADSKAMREEKDVQLVQFFYQENLTDAHVVIIN
jgi:hypothetical protein